MAPSSGCLPFLRGLGTNLGRRFLLAYRRLLPNRRLEAILRLNDFYDGRQRNLLEMRFGS